MKKQHQSPRGRNTIITTLMALGISLSSIQPSWAEPGALTQLPAPNGCIAEVGNGVDCNDGFGLDSPFSVAVSPNGKHVYVASFLSSAVTVFARNKTTGELSQLPKPQGCIAHLGDGATCAEGVGLNGATAATVSPDGKHVYVTASTSTAVTAFARNKTTGVLTQLPGIDGCIAHVGDGVTCTDGVGLNGAIAVTVSPDGKHVYVASSGSDAVTAFARNKTTGVLTQLPGLDGCIANAGDGVTCTDGVGLDFPTSVTVSKDGKHVYVASSGDTIAILARNKTTGSLTQLAAPNGCIAEAGDGMTCSDGVGLDNPTSVTMSKDGKHVYVASVVSHAIATFTRNKNTGALTQLAAPNGCLTPTGDGVSCLNGVGLFGVRSVAVSQDGKDLYAASTSSGSVTTFSRAKTTGILTQLAAPAGCIRDIGDGFTCVDGVGLAGARFVTVSKDGKHVYVVSSSSDAVTVFAREQE